MSNSIPRISKLRKVSKEIIYTNLSSEIKDVLKESFFKIMRENNIKQGTLYKDGSVIKDNFEWTICLEHYLSHIREQLSQDFLFEETPADLEYY